MITVRRNTDLDGRTIYAAPAALGDGSGDDVSNRCTLTDALAILTTPGMILEGSWVLDLASGVYPSFSVPLGLFSRDWLIIRGPSVGGHPNEPLAIIDSAISGGATKGIVIGSYQRVWIQDVETKDFSVAGVDASGHCVVRFWNHWDRGSDSGRRVYNHVRHFHAGGKLIGNDTYGVNELFSCVRDNKENITYASSLAGRTLDPDTDAAVISSYGTQIIGPGVGTSNMWGWFSKENCSGHLDYVTITDCDAGVEFQSFCTANVKYLTLKRCNVGIATMQSEIHQGSYITWGTGADACPQRWNLTGTASVDSDFYGWNNDSDLRLGHRPLLPIAYAFDQTITGTTGSTTEQTIPTAAFTIPAYRLTKKGAWFRVRYWLVVTTLANGTGQLQLRWYWAGNLVCQHKITLPGDTSLDGATLLGDLEMICSQDGAHQRVVSSLLANGLPAMADSARPTSDATIDQVLEPRIILPNTANSVALRVLEVHG